MYASNTWQAQRTVYLHSDWGGGPLEAGPIQVPSQLFLMDPSEEKIESKLKKLFGKPSPHEPELHLELSLIHI